jgi:hypothetical protein
VSDPGAAPSQAFSRGPLLLAALVLVVALVRGVESTSVAITPLRVYDEGITLTEAMRLAGGELPWRDYDPVYGPLEPLLLAPATWAFGPQLLALRLLRALLEAGLVAVITACAWRLGARCGAVAAGGVMVAFVAQGAHPVVLPVLASALLFDLAGPTLRAGPLLGAGALAGAAMLMRLEFGALVLATIAATLVIDRRLAPPTGSPAWRRTLEALGRVVAGASPFAAVWVLLALVGGPARVVAQVQEARVFLPLRALPYPLPPPAGLGGQGLAEHCFFYTLPLVAAVAAVALLLRALGPAARRTPPPRLALHLAALLLGLLPYALARADSAHVLPAFAAAVALGAGALARLERGAGPRALRIACAALVVLLLVRAVRAVHVSSAPGLVSSALPGLRGIRIEPWREAAWSALARVVDHHAGGPDAAVFIGNAERTEAGVVPHHGRVFVNDALSYVVLGRPVGTRHHCFQPGITSSAAKQAQISADLEARDVRVVVLTFGTYTEEQALGRAAPGARLLDDYLLDGWRFVADLSPMWCVLARAE